MCQTVPYCFWPFALHCLPIDWLLQSLTLLWNFSSEQIPRCSVDLESQGLYHNLESFTVFLVLITIELQKNTNVTNGTKNDNLTIFLSWGRLRRNFLSAHSTQDSQRLAWLGCRWHSLNLFSTISRLKYFHSGISELTCFVEKRLLRVKQNQRHFLYELCNRLELI